MNHRKSLVAVLVVAITIAFFVLIAAKRGSPGVSATALTPSVAVDEPVTRVSEPVETNTRSVTGSAAVGHQALAAEDGLTLLQTHCSECHSVKLLEKTRMSHGAWEKTLSRMERYSGTLSDAERAVVLDHLVAPDVP